METCPEAYTLKNQGFFVVVMVLYSTTKASLVLQWFFSGSLGWLMCSMAPLMVLHSTI